MVDFDSDRKTKIKCANDECHNTKGMGNVQVKLKNGKAKLINNVLYVLGMNNNCINVGKLLEKYFSVIMKDNLLKLYDCNQKLIMQSELGRNMTFKVNVVIADTQCLSATSVEGESELWNKRLGHLNFRSLGY